MFGSEVLEIVIGLVFIYLLFSTLVTLLVEYISSVLSFRSENLKRSIERLLDDDQDENDGMSGGAKKEVDGDEAVKLSELFFKHPAIKYLSEKSGGKPSYLSSKKFSKAVLDIIRTQKIIQEVGVTSALIDTPISKALSGLDPDNSSETVRLLKSYAEEASDNIDQFGKKLEDWFDETAERSHGWFNRKIKRWTFWISVGIALILNVDSVRIYGQLSKNHDMRAELAKSAATYLNEKNGRPVDTTSTDVTVAYTQAQQQLVTFYNDELRNTSNRLGLGWGKEACEYLAENDYLNLVWALFGWTITAFAISLGAPFWYDVLNRVTKLRSAGKPDPKKSNETRPLPVG